MRQTTKPISDHSPTTPFTGQDDRDLDIGQPELRHGGGMWEVARDSGTLDLNSSYAYLLFCRDFAVTSRVAVRDGEVVGFVLGYLRPEARDRLFIWQIAVDEEMRGHRIAARMLDALITDLPAVRWVETTITDDNAASQRLFRSFAKRHGAKLTTAPLFEATDFPDDHQSEAIHLIGPLGLAP